MGIEYDVGKLHVRLGETITVSLYSAQLDLGYRRLLPENPTKHQPNALSKTKDKVQGRLLLDEIIRKSAAVLKSLASQNETLVRGMPSLSWTLDLTLGRVGELNLKCDGLVSEGFDDQFYPVLIC